MKSARYCSGAYSSMSSGTPLMAARFLDESVLNLANPPGAPGEADMEKPLLGDDISQGLNCYPSFVLHVSPAVLQLY